MQRINVTHARSNQECLKENNSLIIDFELSKSQQVVEQIIKAGRHLNLLSYKEEPQRNKWTRHQKLNNVHSII